MQYIHLPILTRIKHSPAPVLTGAGLLQCLFGKVFRTIAFQGWVVGLFKVYFRVLRDEPSQGRAGFCRDQGVVYKFGIGF